MSEETTDYEAMLWRITKQSTQRTAGIIRMFDMGLLSLEEAKRLLTETLGRANIQAIKLADASFAAQIMAKSGQAIPVQGLGPREGMDDALYRAVSTLLPSKGDRGTNEQFDRLAEEEPLKAANDALWRAAKANKNKVVGYRRVTEKDRCELCYWLWKEGYVYDLSKPMHRHPRCRCEMDFVLAPEYVAWAQERDKQLSGQGKHQRTSAELVGLSLQDWRVLRGKTAN